ncbi:MAG: hypothetical protein H0X65_11095 [Gemmatimonadetes bacterium]|nr:hypothetical protein [Gemmatimonadota bacterium]
MLETFQHLLRPLSEARARLLRARTSGEVLGTLGDVLVPEWADGLRVVQRGAGQPAY